MNKRPVFGMSKDEQERLAAQVEQAKKRVVLRTPVVDGDELIALELLEVAKTHYTDLIVTLYRKVRFIAGSYDKRFVGDIYTLIAARNDWTLTEKQAAFLDTLCYRYRRQLPRDFNPGWDGKK